MAKDFRADQIRFHTILASGTMWPRAVGAIESHGSPSEQETHDGNHPYLGMVIMSASNAADHTGGFADRGMFKEFGNEPWLVFSGTANTGELINNPSDGPPGSAVLFLGDVIVSGTLFGKRQVINVDKTVDGDFMVHDRMFLSGNFYATDTSLSGDTSDVIVTLEGNNNSGDAGAPPRILFRKANAATRTSWVGENRANSDCFVVFSGSRNTRGQQLGGIALFEGDLHISGNVTADGTGLFNPARNITLNNSASAAFPYPSDWRNENADTFTTAGPVFAHATTGAMAADPANPAAGPRNHTNPFFIQQDVWQAQITATTAHKNADTNLYNIPSHWYSNFVNSSSIDQGTKRGGFRFIVAASGNVGTSNIPYANANHNYTVARDGRGTPNSSVFTISGSGDIALDPYKSFVFDSRTASALTITHVQGSGDTNSKLSFRAPDAKPVHYEFTKGEVTGSGGFYLPKRDSSAQGRWGQDLGIMFQGNSATFPATAGLFYNDTASGHPIARFEDPNPNVFVLTSSDDLKIGAGDDIIISATDNMEISTGQGGDLDVFVGGTSNGDFKLIVTDDFEIQSGDKMELASKAGKYHFYNKDGLASYVDRTGVTVNGGTPVFEIDEDATSYGIKLHASGSSGNDYFSIRSTSADGAYTLKTHDASAANANLTVFADGTLDISGTKNVSIDSDPTAGGTVAIGGGAIGQTIQMGKTGAHASTTKVELNAVTVDVNVGTTGYFVNSDGGANIVGTTSTLLRASAGPTVIRADGVNGVIHLQADSTTDGIKIATDTTNVPVGLGGNASMVTVGHNLTVNNDAEIVGNLTVRGDFIKGHIVTASLGDPLLLINSGSTIAGSGGGIAISSGSSVVLPKSAGHGVGTFSPAMVFGRDTTTTRDTFLAGRDILNIHPGVTEDLSNATPIDMRAAGYRTAAGMTLTSSAEQGVVLSNPAANGTLRVHAGTTGGNLGNLIFSGSNYSFEAGSNQKLFLDVTNDVYLQADQGTNRLDINLASEAARLTGTAKLEFTDANHFISKAGSSLLTKAAGSTVAFSGSDYSFDLSNTENLYFREGADAVKWTINSNMLELDLAGSLIGLKLSDANNIYFASNAKMLNGAGQTSNNSLTYRTDDQIIVKSHGDSSGLQPSRATVYATGQDENETLLAGNGGILIMSGTSTASPWNGFASIGYSSNELDVLGTMEGKHADVTLIFSGSQGQFPAKTTRGTSLFMGDVVFSGSVAVGHYIYHEGQEASASGAPQTAIELQDRGIKLIASGTEIFHADGAGSILSANFNPDSAQVSTQIKGYSAGADKPIMMAVAHDTSNRATFFNPFSTANPNIDPANGHDVKLFFSGSKNSRYTAGDTDPAVRGTALFGGDVYVSGALGVGSFELGNLTLTNANAYLRFFDTNHFVQKNGNDLEFRDNNLGVTKTLTQLAALGVSTDLFSVTRTAVSRPNYGMTTGSFSFDTGFAGAAANSPRSAAQASNNSSGQGNSDVYFFVSGAVGSKARAPSDFTQAYQRRAVALFGGDVHISGTLTTDNTTFRSSLDMAYDTSNSGDPVAGGGRTIIADTGYVEIKKAAVNPVSNSRLFSVSGSAAFGQLRIAPLADANGHYQYGGVFVTGSAGILGFGVGTPSNANLAFTINSNNNILMMSTGGNSRKISWDGSEASTFIQYANTNGTNPGPKILNFANRNSNGRISFSVGAAGTVTGAGQGTGFEGHVAVSGSILPGFDSEYNLGSPSHRWANVYTGDLHLKNTRGDWTIYEERDMLVVVNNITGKRYKMGLTPLEDNE